MKKKCKKYNGCISIVGLYCFSSIFFFAAGVMAKGWPLGFMSHVEVLRVALRAKRDMGGDMETCWWGS